MANYTTVKENTFLETFHPTPHLRKPESDGELWVFWSKDEGSRSQNNPFSGDVGSRMIYDKIKSAFSKVKCYDEKVILQFWAPITIEGRWLLSSSGQPFAFSNLENGLEKYRLCSLEYQYNINDPTFISGAPAIAFLSGFPEIVDVYEEGGPLTHYALEHELITSIMLPIFWPSQSGLCCIGVIECSINEPGLEFSKEINRALEEVGGLSMFHVQERIPYKTIDGLKPAKDRIEEALKVVCTSHNVVLAQVWIPYEAENHVIVSSYAEGNQMKRMLALKLTGYTADMVSKVYFGDLEAYYNLCDMVPLKTGEELVEKTLQDYEPRLYKPNSYQLMASTFLGLPKTSGLVICLRSSDTCDFCYVFEFVWVHTSNYVIPLEDLLVTLKRHLPSFKFASGAELGDELDVIDAENSKKSEVKKFKIFQGKGLSPIPKALEEEKTTCTVKCNTTPKCKTTPILLPREGIESQFGNTMADAAKNLNVSLSTLRRKCKAYGISEWQGPNVVKRNVVNHLPVKRNGNILTIKAECANDMIKFHLRISEVRFVTVEEKIGMKFNLTLGNYKLKYLDEDGDWILLTSDQDMNDCIKKSTNLNRTVVRLRVLPFT